MVMTARRFLLLLPLLGAPRPSGAVDYSNRFPCDASVARLLPPLLLLGEEHDDPVSSGLRARFARAGARGALHVLLEVGLDGMPLSGGTAPGLTASLGGSANASRLFGIENSPASLFADLWIVSSARAPRGYDGVEFAQYLLDRLPQEPELREPVQAAFSKGLITPGRGAELLRGALRAASPGPLGVRLHAPKASAEDLTSLREALVHVRVEMAAILRREYDDPRAQALLGRLDADADAPSLPQGLMLDLRDRDYALSAASHYCSAAREGKTLAVIVGHAHAPGITRLLSAWWPGKLPLRRMDTHTSLGGQDAQRALDDISAPAVGATVRPALKLPDAFRVPDWAQ